MVLFLWLIPKFFFKKLILLFFNNFIKLSLIYNPEYINKFIAEHIYMIVTNFVLEFNTVNKLNEPSETPKELSIE